jgi:hypothetical protein
VSESRLQEIVTRAVVGRAERRMTWSHTVPAESITDVLGVRVTDWTVSVKEHDGKAVVELVADCDLWCGNRKQTKVMHCNSRHSEVFAVRTSGKVLGESNLRVRLGEAPRATGVKVENGQISVSLEGEATVEMSALARVWVKAYDLEEEVLEDLDDPEEQSSGSEE